MKPKKVLPAAGAHAGAAAGAASTGLPGNVPVQPGVTDLARNAAIVNANVASNLAALGMAADVPGVRAGESSSFALLLPMGPYMGLLRHTHPVTCTLSMFFVHPCILQVVGRAQRR